MHTKKQVIQLCGPGRCCEDVTEIVSQYHFVQTVTHDEVTLKHFGECSVVFVDADLSQIEIVSQLQRVLTQPACARIPIVFVLEEMNRSDVLWANKLGACNIITRPICELEVATLLDSIIGPFARRVRRRTAASSFAY